MTYLLDTNAWIAYLRQKYQKLLRRLMREDPAGITLCSVVLGELFYGAYHGPANILHANLTLIARLRQPFVSLPFNDDIAPRYGEVRAYLDARGTPIGPNDLMIASIGLVHNLGSSEEFVGGFWLDSGATMRFLRHLPGK